MLPTLHTRAVAPATVELLRRLIQVPELSAFALAGGTALALYKGHRISIDLDLFTQIPFDGENLLEQVRASLAHHLAVQNIGIARNTLNLTIGGIKTDFLRFDYPLLEPIRTIEEIRLFGLSDIAAMKLSAIAGRGAKKDFFDLDCLLRDYTLRELFTFFEAKFGGDLFHLRKSIVYFDDADMEPDPISLVNVSWQSVKARIRTAAVNI
jgi:Nucleotidyl transferase AbiEii toxin, Type IV TA system